MHYLTLIASLASSGKQSGAVELTGVYYFNIKDKKAVKVGTQHSNIALTSFDVEFVVREMSQNTNFYTR